MKAFPKLLIATEFGPNSTGGGSAILRQMLRDYPTDKISWWSCRPDDAPYFDFRAREHRVAAMPRGLYPNRRLVRLRSALADALWTGAAAANLRKFIHEAKPDAIWSVPHLWSIHPLRKTLADLHTRLHVSLHDYMDHDQYRAQFGDARCASWTRGALELYARADSRDAICDAMADDLAAATHTPRPAIRHAGVESEQIARIESGLPEAATLKIGYAGSIIAPDAFQLFIASIEQIRSRLPRPVELHIFTSHDYTAAPWFNANWMRWRGGVGEAELQRELESCAWGFAPMHLTDASPRYNRFSLPTKFVSYLSAGLPIVVLGHPESSLVRVASRYNLGWTGSTREVGELGDALLPALSRAAPRRAFRDGLLACIRHEFNAQAMRASLWSNFSG